MDEPEHCRGCQSGRFADALSATPLAKKYDAPILLTDAGTLTAKPKLKLPR
ncbi:cell wall-binding repeat-containing protein [Bacillus licheniformis]|nr:cell wall-binding repeat-containing protein [Bacillus licheniformis]